MIRSHKDFKYYLDEDMAAHGVKRWIPILSGMVYPLLRYQRKLRWTEYTLNCFAGPFFAPLRLYVRWRLRQAGMKLGFSIYANVFGPGLCIGHYGTIVVNPDCRVGAWCQIHPGVTLGRHNGKSPRVGDHVFFASGSKAYGDIYIGPYTDVGMNAVVTKSFPEGHCNLLGVPARAYPLTRALPFSGDEGQAEDSSSPSPAQRT